MNHNKYEVRQKEYIRMEKELDVLRDKLRNRPLFELKEPIHRGWMITYVLQPHISNWHNSFDIQQVIDIGFEPHHIRSVKHVRMMRAGEKGYWHTDYKGKVRWMSFSPHRCRLKQKDVDRLAPQIRKYFELDYYNNYRYKRSDYIVVIPKDWVKIRVRPYFITHSTEVGGELKKRAEFLEDKLKDYWRVKYGYERGYRKEWSKNPYRVRTRIAVSRFLKKEIEDIPGVVYKKEIKT